MQHVAHVFVFCHWKHRDRSPGTSFWGNRKYSLMIFPCTYIRYLHLLMSVVVVAKRYKERGTSGWTMESKNKWHTKNWLKIFSLCVKDFLSYLIWVKYDWLFLHSSQKMFQNNNWLCCVNFFDTGVGTFCFFFIFWRKIKLNFQCFFMFLFSLFSSKLSPAKELKSSQQSEVSIK